MMIITYSDDKHYLLSELKAASAAGVIHYYALPIDLMLTNAFEWVENNLVTRKNASGLFFESEK